MMTWNNFKTWLDATGALLSETQKGTSYILTGQYNNITKWCKIKAVQANDKADYEANYQSRANPTVMDSNGVYLSRTKIAPSGWHYQAHSVEFEVNKLGSIYNKDYEGNDLGFADLKVYNSSGTELTTQGSADTGGVRTVVTWKPDFDFEIVSGNVRQITRETVDSYLYVNARVATGLAAPNDWLVVPFVQGGVNLQYIGADEPLKTDGRTPKLFNGTNGDYFELVVNYEADLLTNANRHRMSIIFEIYKHPTT